MYRGTSSNDLNYIKDTPDGGETITWTNVGEETDIFFGFLISHVNFYNFYQVLSS
jgi:hypothetical protein